MRRAGRFAADVDKPVSPIATPTRSPTLGSAQQ
jgi:hypothetical protein